ncbi:N-succinylarginine dihydrolase, partial [Burkholderia pseudomallei]
PDEIDARVFPTEELAVGNRDTLFCNVHAFVDQQAVYAALAASLGALGAQLNVIEVPDGAVSVADAVGSYLFNSQLLARDDGSQMLV